jgi:PAS domain S-box-containing protein
MKGKWANEKRIVQALVECTRSVLTARNFKEAALAVYGKCKELVGSTAGYVAILSEDESRNEMVLMDMGNLDCPLGPNTMLMPLRGFREKICLTGEIVLQNNFSASEWQSFLPPGHKPLENVLFAPLMLEGKAVGLLSLANKAGGFSQNDIDIVKAFAELAALGLRTTRAIGDLTEQKNFLRSILTTANDAVIVVNEQGRVTFWNKAAEKCFGYAADEIVGRPCSILMPKELREFGEKGLARAIQYAKEKFAGRTVELMGLRKNGEIFPIELSLAGWSAENGNNYTGIIRDITTKVKALEQLREQTEEIKSLARFPDENVNPVLRVGQDGIIIYGNPASLPLFSFWGCEPGGKIPGHIHTIVKLSLSSKKVKELQTAFDGKIYLFKVAPIPSKKYVNLYGSDITELKKTEKDLRENEELFRTVFEMSPDAIIINRLADGKFIAVNGGFLELSGFAGDEVLGATALELKIWKKLQDREKMFSILREQGRVRNFETSFRGKNGHTLPALVSVKIITLQDEPHLLAVTRDISELKKAEKTLRKLNKTLEEKVSRRTADLKQVNEDLLRQINVRRAAEEALKGSEKELRVLSEKLLSAEETERKRIAHDIHDSIGQVLSAIKFSVENAVRIFSATGDGSGIKNLQGLIPITQQAIEEVRRIIMDLRPSTLDDLGIAATISWFCREFASTYPQIKVEKEISAKEEDIPLRLKTTIYRILQEAMNNAAKHGSPQVVSVSLKKRKDGITLHIADDGQGFNVEKILAGQAGRRGVGLASMKERTELAGGIFSLHSTAGRGTRIKALWPVEKRKRLKDVKSKK